jgi:hypothetical protein
MANSIKFTKSCQFLTIGGEKIKGIRFSFALWRGLIYHSGKKYTRGLLHDEK